MPGLINLDVDPRSQCFQVRERSQKLRNSILGDLQLKPHSCHSLQPKPSSNIDHANATTHCGKKKCRALAMMNDDPEIALPATRLFT